MHWIWIVVAAALVLGGLFVARFIAVGTGSAAPNTSLWTRLQATLVSDWKQAHRWASLRFAALAGVANYIVEQWPALPPEFKQLLPLWLAKAIAWAAFAGIFAGRLWKQKTPADGPPQP